MTELNNTSNQTSSTFRTMEVAKKIAYGSSKLVPSVQELAKQNIVTLPPRYERSDLDFPDLSNPTSFPTVPVIDMQKLLYGDEIKSELNRLHLACREWGFFQLVNHGVEKTLLENLKHGVQAFFDLSVEEKKRFWQKENEVEGFGQGFVMSDEQKLDWADMFFLTASPVYARKPHLFPKLPQQFRDTLDSYSMEVKNLSTMILGAMEKALMTEANEITRLFEDGMQTMRMNYYPPCSQPDKVIGLTPHSDGGGLTILLQLNEVEGLQIRKDGVWIPITPLPNAFIVNIGDIIEIITNGTYPSIEHRGTIDKVKERLSIATFNNPRFDVEIGPAKSLVTPHTPAIFKRIMMEDYFKGLFSRELNGKSYRDAMRIENDKVHPS